MFKWTQGKPGHLIIISLLNFVFTVFFTFPEKTCCMSPCLKVTCLLYTYCLLVLQLVVMNIIYTLCRTQLGGQAGSGCHWAPASLEWNMHPHLSTLYTLYYIYPYIYLYTHGHTKFCVRRLFSILFASSYDIRHHTQGQMSTKYVSEQIPLLSLLLPIYICTPVVVEVFIVLEVWTGTVQSYYKIPSEWPSIVLRFQLLSIFISCICGQWITLPHIY